MQTFLRFEEKYYVTLSRVLSTIVAVEKQGVLHILSVCICSLRYPARNAHASYCHLWSAPLYNIFPPYLKNGTIFGEKKLVTTNCVFSFSLQLLSETFLILRGTERDMTENVYQYSCKVTVILVRF
jgi:hypothetical protein